MQKQRLRWGLLLNEQYIDSERYMIRTGGHELRLDETEENG